MFQYTSDKMIKRRLYLLLPFLVLVLILPSCASKNETGLEMQSSKIVTASGLTLNSAKTRITSPDIKRKTVEELTKGNGSFALDMYKQLKENNDNLLFSPYSISLALAMTYSGANSTTAEQIASTMYFDIPQAELHPAFNWLDSELTSRTEVTGDSGDESFRLNIINDIWGQKDYEFRKSFLDTLAAHYGAGLRIVDYRNNPEAARIAINDWVSRETEEKITELIPQGIINELTRLVLTNALYFKAAWEKPFSKDSIGLRPFHLLNGNETKVYMMKQTNTFPYIERNDYQAVELPYNGQGISMVVILPSEGKFTEFEGRFDFSQLRSILSGLDDERVRLSIPKYKLESDFQLDKALSLMGMPEAFDWRKADFTRMTTEKDEPLYIGTVLHKSFIDVDEKGTEAAAATAVVMMTGAAPGSKPDEPKIMTVDRPFIFLIRDMETGTILFLGRVMLPETNDREGANAQITPDVSFPVTKESSEIMGSEVLTGELTVENGYLKVNDFIIVWPYGYSWKHSASDIWVINNLGQVIARAGDEFTFIGMEISHSEVRELTDMTILEKCDDECKFFLCRTLTDTKDK